MDNVKVLEIQNRIHKLTQRDPVRNAHIIAKLNRRLRAIV